MHCFFRVVELYIFTVRASMFSVSWPTSLISGNAARMSMILWPHVTLLLIYLRLARSVYRGSTRRDELVMRNNYIVIVIRLCRCYEKTSPGPLSCNGKSLGGLIKMNFGIPYYSITISCNLQNYFKRHHTTWQRLVD